MIPGCLFQLLWLVGFSGIFNTGAVGLQSVLMWFLPQLNELDLEKRPARGHNKTQLTATAVHILS